MNSTEPESSAVQGEEVQPAAHTGMRREWNFELTLQHESARVNISMLPFWRGQFVDPDSIESLHKLDRDVKHCPMMPFLCYTDHTTAAQVGSFWEETPKSVTLMYSHIPPSMTLRGFCKRAVQYVLQDPRVASVDEQTKVHRLSVGRKVSGCSSKLGGIHDSFHFYYVVADKIRSRSEYRYAIGTIIGQRGYLMTVSCVKEVELRQYVKLLFLQHYTSEKNCKFDCDVTYEECSSTVLKEQQQLFGELCFEDRDAGVRFAFPMHPAVIRPDYSPIQSVGVGSISCMTFELEAYQKLMDDFVDTDITGMPKYKVNNVALFLDVEDVARMNYPGIMTIDQYSKLKVQRLCEVFRDARTVGSPISLTLGSRAGRSVTVTFPYEGLGGVVKGMLVSTLIGNYGVTVMYFTKLGGGLFDAHLYIFQQMLRSVAFCAVQRRGDAGTTDAAAAGGQPVAALISGRRASTTGGDHADTHGTNIFSRHTAVSVRLTDQDLPRAYSGAPANERTVVEKHYKALAQSLDGRAEGARVVPVSVERGGLQRVTLAALVADKQAGDKDEETNDEELDDASAVSVSSIPHLASLLDDDKEDEEELLVDNKEAATTSSIVAPAVETPQVPPHQPEGGTEGSTALPAPTAGGSTSEATEEHSPPPPPPRSGAASSVNLTSTDSVGQAATPSQLGTANVLVPEVRDEAQRIKELLQDDSDGKFFGPSLHDIYLGCCEQQRCKPNSYLLKKLPLNARFTVSVEELDLTSNYLGHNGFVALLQLLEHLPNLRSLFLCDMALDNSDIENLCEVMATNRTIHLLDLRNNVKLTLPVTKVLTKLLQKNQTITTLCLQGTKIGASLISKIEAEVAARRQF